MINFCPVFPHKFLALNVFFSLIFILPNLL